MAIRQNIHSGSGNRNFLGKKNTSVLIGSDQAFGGLVGALT